MICKDFLPFLFVPLDFKLWHPTFRVTWKIHETAIYVIFLFVILSCQEGFVPARQEINSLFFK